MAITTIFAITPIAFARQATAIYRGMNNSSRAPKGSFRWYRGSARQSYKGLKGRFE